MSATLPLSPDELLSTTRAVRKRLDFDRPVPDEVVRAAEGTLPDMLTLLSSLGIALTGASAADAVDDLHAGRQWLAGKGCNQRRIIGQGIAGTQTRGMSFRRVAQVEGPGIVECPHVGSCG